MRAADRRRCELSGGGFDVIKSLCGKDRSSHGTVKLLCCGSVHRLMCDARFAYAKHVCLVVVFCKPDITIKTM